MPWALEITVIADLSEELWNLALQPQKTYLYYHNAYGHQIWQDCGLPWEAPIHKITWPFDHAVLRDHMTNQNHYNSTNRVAIATKLCSMVTCLDGLLRSGDKRKPLYLHYQSACGHQTWQNGNLPWVPTFKITWSFDPVISPLPNCPWPPNLERCWLTLRGS